MTYTDAIEQIIEKSEKWPEIDFYITRAEDGFGYAVRTSRNLAKATPLLTYRAGRIIQACGYSESRAYCAKSSDGLRVVRMSRKIFKVGVMTIVPGSPALVSFHQDRAQAEKFLRKMERSIKAGKMILIPGTRFEIVSLEIVG